MRCVCGCTQHDGECPCGCTIFEADDDAPADIWDVTPCLSAAEQVHKDRHRHLIGQRGTHTIPQPRGTAT